MEVKSFIQLQFLYMIFAYCTISKTAHNRYFQMTVPLQGKSVSSRPASDEEEPLKRMGEMDTKEAKDKLFNRISDSFVNLFFSINPDMKDKFLNVASLTLPVLFSLLITFIPVPIAGVPELLGSDHFRMLHWMFPNLKNLVWSQLQTVRCPHMLRMDFRLLNRNL